MEPDIIATPPCRTLAGFSLDIDCDEGLFVESLEPGTILTVDTDHSRYRLTVVDGSRREVLVQGGAMFPRAVPAVLQGASAGGTVVKTGWIGLNLRIELFVDPQWVMTSPVRSIAISRTAAPGLSAAAAIRDTRRSR